MGDTTHAGRRPVPYTAEDRENDEMAQRELDRIREAQAVEPRVMVERVAIEALREALALRTNEVAELQAQVDELSRHAFGQDDAPVAVVDDEWSATSQVMFVGFGRYEASVRLTMGGMWAWSVYDRADGGRIKEGAENTEAEAKAAAVAAAKGMK